MKACTSVNTMVTLLIKLNKNIEQLLHAQNTKFLDMQEDIHLTSTSITPKDFGQEEIQHIYDNHSLMKHLFNSYELGITKFIDLIWFDAMHPKNSNLKIITPETAQICQYSKWNVVKISSIVQTIADYLGCYFQQALEKRALLTEDFLDSYMEKIGCALGWDLSFGDFDLSSDNYDIPDEDREKTKSKLHLFIKVHLAKKI